MSFSMNRQVQPPQPPIPDKDPDPHLINSQSQQLSRDKESESTGLSPLQLLDVTPQKQFASFCKHMKQTTQQQFQDCLQTLAKYFKEGYSKYFTSSTDLMRKMMNHFTTLGKRMRILSSKKKTSSDTSQVQFMMMFILSLIAELLTQNPKLYFPFTRRFLMNVFSIERYMVQTSHRKNQILAILGTILQNISKQGRLLRRYKIIQQVKQTTLINYEIISELSTIQLFNKSISNLVRQGAKFSLQQFQKHKVEETLMSIINKKNAKILMIQMKLALICGGVQQQPAKKQGFKPFNSSIENFQAEAEELFEQEKIESTPEQMIQEGEESKDNLERQI